MVLGAKCRLKIKKKIIQEIAQKKYTVKELRQRLAALKEPSKPKDKTQKSLSQVLGRPEMLFDDEFASVLKDEYLATLQLPTIQNLQNKAAKKIKEIEKNVNELYAVLETQRSYLKQYDGLIGSLRAVEEQKKGK